MHRLRFGILGLLLLGGIPGAAAAPRLDTGALSTPLGCAIRDTKVVVITNTTGSTIPAGTRISYDTIRDPDRAHVGGTVSGGALAPGAIVQIGAWQSYSCTAWMPRVLVLAP
jgi:hypothetical protein